ncbi:MAG: hypothetical protein KGD57_04070 [Candidatus Lokiarchaeota archaeon]|nr:hypothetical protein [Candidatus Lokiarchaeota archaeon]
MSYIEKKYLDKIMELFYKLSIIEENILNLINFKAINKIDEIAKECAHLNKNMNLILKKYYPEIKNMDDKLKIKSIMKFYYDLLDNLIDFIRQVENYQKIDNNYFESLIKFIKSKDNLIENKYKSIATQELTSFYDKKSRENLESILKFKLKMNTNQYFTFGALEEEIKKISQILGVNKLLFKAPTEKDKQEFRNVNSVISYFIEDMYNKDLIEKIGNEIKKFLASKKYFVVIRSNNILTDAELFLK